MMEEGVMEREGVEEVGEGEATEMVLMMRVKGRTEPIISSAPIEEKQKERMRRVVDLMQICED